MIGRLVPRYPTAQPSQADARCAEPAAPPAHPAGAAFSDYTESGPKVATRPDQTVPVGASAGTVTLSDRTLILLRAIASYEQCSNEHAVALALADYATKIGAGPLARAVLDERDRLAAGGAGPIDDVPDDLGDLPEFVRVDVVRFGARADRAAREADGNIFRGMRR